ncbi:hypothetical protein LGN07_32240 [Burkholderia cepacia]|uniref:hypothetical protein n=1 Tax=Burkholderia cepacia TaxID=292 RepID=UPI0007721086|nr:hypothetical protein [Burkholderia cepacia]KVS37436.1 hypothetical protein WK36_07975 [Burkholderia cepacia]MCA8123398.1 hypothetical protein [Burkholderia cepacia]
MSETKRDYLAPGFRSALTRDHFELDSVGEYATVPSNLIGDVHRAADAIRTIARLVHNSLCEPEMSGAEPLGLSAHLGLLNAADLVGKYLRDAAASMHDCARGFAERAGEANHE